MSKAKAYPSFRGKPLVRNNNAIYYGDPEQPFIALLQIMTTKKLGDLIVPDKVSVQILSTDETLHSSQRVTKRTEKDGLYGALMIASIWLERALSNK